ncbi:bacterial low temperature requirement A domain-containing protein [Trichoderma chlorosporum]
MSFAVHGRRRRPTELLLPDGRKIIVTLPENLEDIRRKYQGDDDTQVEVVVHGSVEHGQYLRQSRDHHEERRQLLRQQHGPAFEEWEDIHNRLSSVTSELDRLENQASGLHGNFSKYGYDAAVRTYNDDDPHIASSRTSISEKSRAQREEGARHGETTKLFKRPVIRQWFHQGLLWRASEPTEIMAIELFLDLVYVGIIHSNGEHMAEEATGYELLRFFITFVMTWKIWTSVTLTLSWFETDDVVTRLQVLFCISCLLGFTTNMTHIFVEDPASNTYVQLVSFYLATRVFSAIFFGVTAYLLPMIKGVMICQLLAVIIPIALWIASIHVDMPGRLGFIIPALFFDMYGLVFFLPLALYAIRGDAPESGWAKRLGSMFEFSPAISIEHRVERMNAFVSLVLGYSVVAILFQSQGGYNINGFLGKAILGLMQAFTFNWIYFDIDGSHLNLHAIRRSPISAGIWELAHLLFVMGYIVATSALSRLVLATDVPNTNPEQLAESYRDSAEDHFNAGVRFFYCHGLAIALLSMGAISFSHDHKKPSTLRLHKNIRLANRIAVCIIMFFLPLAHSLRSLDLISVTMGLSIWVLIVELWGKSSKDDPFIGEKAGSYITYHAKCKKEDLKRMTTADERPPSGEILELVRGEKTAV